MIQDFLSVTFGWIILFGLIFINIYGIKLLISFNPLAAGLYFLLFVFGLIIEIASQPNCACISDEPLFINFTKYYYTFLETIAKLLMIILVSFIIFKAARNALYGEVGLGCRYFFEYSIKLFVIIFGINLTMALVGCMACPLICFGIFDLQYFHECFKETILNWLGIGY